MTTQNKNRYYLMRHGESLANRRSLIVSYPSNALDDFGLTSMGAKQVMQAAMNTRLNSDTIIVSSDYMRARETAIIMHNVIDVKEKIKYNTGLRERNFGDWELTDHAHYQEVWKNDLTRPDLPIKNVEPVSQVLKRTLHVIWSLEKEYDGKDILLVGHGDTLQILLAYHHGINARFHRSLSSIGNADIRVLSRLDTGLKSIA